MGNQSADVVNSAVSSTATILYTDEWRAYHACRFHTPPSIMPFMNGLAMTMVAVCVKFIATPVKVRAPLYATFSAPFAAFTNIIWLSGRGENKRKMGFKGETEHAFYL